MTRSRLWLGLVFFAGLTLGLFVGIRAQPLVASNNRNVELDLADGGVYRVRRVVDGDTIVLENGLHVRYSGINTPESGRFIKDPAPFAAAAVARNTELVENKRVRVRLGPEPLDPYGRVIAQIHVVPEDGAREIDVGNVLVREGLARVMSIDIDGHAYGELKAAQLEAQNAGRGLWSAAPGTALKPFCAASGSTLYHASTCHIAQRIAPANRLEYASAEEAEAAGLKSCGRCGSK